MNKIKQYLKEFFFLKGAKLGVFIVLAFFGYFLWSNNNTVLGNMTWLDLLFLFLLAYMLVNLLWFMFRSLKHFAIAFVIIVLLVCLNWVMNERAMQKRSEADDSCGGRSTQTTETIRQYMKCMSEKGYPKYR